jgi:catechol 2,3-dioxygenase-like lactoylglutathione lyase family enzyme
VSRIQLALNVADLNEAIAFYTSLFATEPAKIRPGYANFAITDPPLKLVLVEDRTREPGSINHLGIEVEGIDDIERAGNRLTFEGLATSAEAGVNCCHALQDKLWLDAPGGERGEIYTVLADTETPLRSSCC